KPLLIPSAIHFDTVSGHMPKQVAICTQQLETSLTVASNPLHINLLLNNKHRLKSRLVVILLHLALSSTQACMHL
ncbi:hypothetical protein RSW44_24835, partial [Escherichia coli]|uniref:hypothetical protein n=1 Tax=Escherichia coli TaxID=562 RepID=UPI0028E076F6